MKKPLVTASIVLLVALTAAAQKKTRVAESFIAAWKSHKTPALSGLLAIYCTCYVSTLG